MPKAPDKIRNQEINLIDNIRNLLLDDSYIKTVIAGPGDGLIQISDKSLILQTICWYPAISVYFNGETEFLRNSTGQYTQQVLSKYYIDVADQAEQDQTARDNAYRLCKDIKYTLSSDRNLRHSGNSTTAANSDVTVIEPALFENIDNLWTYILTMTIDVLTYDCVR